MTIQRRRREGVVLFAVVIIIALVSLSAYSYTLTMQAEFEAARAQGDRYQAELVAASGVEYVSSLTAMTRFERYSLGGLDQNVQIFQSVLVDGNLESTRTGLFSIVSPQAFDVETSLSDSQLETFKFGLVNESSKLSLATLLAWDEESPGTARMALMHLPGMSEIAADSILDWIDRDDDVREYGAESEFYRMRNPPREIANRVPLALEELLQVRGVSRTFLFGFDVNQNFRLEQHEKPDPNQQPPPSPTLQPSPIGLNASDQNAVGANANSSPTQSNPATENAFPRDGISTGNTSAFGTDDNQFRPWSRFLTVYSAERNESQSGQPRIDLNANDLKNLHRDLSQQFTSEIADFVIALRIYGPYKGTEKVTAEPLPSVKTKASGKFEIASLRELLSAKIGIGSDDDLKVYAGPWNAESRSYSNPGASRGSMLRNVSQGDGQSSSFASFCDATTLSREKVTRGRINIDLAPREVLRTIPGLTPEIIEDLLAARTKQTIDEPTFHVHPYWLVEEDIIDIDTFAAILPHVTVGGDVYSFQVIAYYDDDSAWHRANVVVDGTEERTIRLYYSRLVEHGRGFSFSELAPAANAVPGSTPR